LLFKYGINTKILPADYIIGTGGIIDVFVVSQNSDGKVKSSLCKARES